MHQVINAPAQAFYKTQNTLAYWNKMQKQYCTRVLKGFLKKFAKFARKHFLQRLFKRKLLPYFMQLYWKGQ